MDCYFGVSQGRLLGGKDPDRPFAPTLGGVHDPGGSGYNHGNYGTRRDAGCAIRGAVHIGHQDLVLDIVQGILVDEMMLGTRQPVERGVAGRVESPGLSDCREWW